MLHSDNHAWNYYSFPVKIVSESTRQKRTFEEGGGLFYQVIFDAFSTV